jgi:hypothetical protein
MMPAAFIAFQFCAKRESVTVIPPLPSRIARLGFALQGIDTQHRYLTQRGISPSTARLFGVGMYHGAGFLALQHEQQAAANHSAQSAVGLFPLPGLAQLLGESAPACSRILGDQLVTADDVTSIRQSGRFEFVSVRGVTV